MKSLQAQIFSYCTTNINPPGEIQVNEWLAQNPDIEIVELSQSESMVAMENRIESNLTITVLYRGEVKKPAPDVPDTDAMDGEIN